MSVPPTPKRIKMEEEKMDFEDPDEQRHDCVLVVKEKKFYCVKATLARHAIFFDELFFARSANKKKKEHVLVEPETPEGFQAFLEVIHGVKSLKDENIKEVLGLASRWSAGVAKNRCLEFLSSDQCQMDLKAKFQMACELELGDYLEFLLDGVPDTKTMDPLISEEVMILNQPLIGVIFKKFFELSRKPDVIVEPPARAPPPMALPNHWIGADEVRIVEPARPQQYVPPHQRVFQALPVRPALGVPRRMPPPFQEDESNSEDEEQRGRPWRRRSPEGVVLAPRHRRSPARFGFN